MSSWLLWKGYFQILKVVKGTVFQGLRNWICVHICVLTFVELKRLGRFLEGTEICLKCTILRVPPLQQTTQTHRSKKAWISQVCITPPPHAHLKHYIISRSLCHVLRVGNSGEITSHTLVWTQTSVWTCYNRGLKLRNAPCKLSSYKKDVFRHNTAQRPSNHLTVWCVNH